MKKWKTAFIALFILVITLFPGCMNRAQDDILCDADAPLYAAFGPSLSAHAVHTASNQLLVHKFESHIAVEMFDVQAYPLLEAQRTIYWYPLYTVTAVIAIDREGKAIPPCGACLYYQRRGCQKAV